MIGERDDSHQNPLWGDASDDSEVAFLERLQALRNYVSDLIGDYDAAVGFSRAAEPAMLAVARALDAAIEAEDEALERLNSKAHENEPDGEDSGRP